MGMSMSAYYVKPGDTIENKIEFCWWRKFWDLHRIIINEIYSDMSYEQKQELDVNCELHEISLETLNRINTELHVSCDIFLHGDKIFGVQPVFDEWLEETDRFIRLARQYLQDGCKVYYYPNW